MQSHQVANLVELWTSTSAMQVMHRPGSHNDIFLHSKLDTVLRTAFCDIKRHTQVHTKNKC